MVMQLFNSPDSQVAVVVDGNYSFHDPNFARGGMNLLQQSTARRGTLGKNLGV